MNNLWMGGAGRGVGPREVILIGGGEIEGDDGKTSMVARQGGVDDRIIMGAKEKFVACEKWVGMCLHGGIAIIRLSVNYSHRQ